MVIQFLPQFYFLTSYRQGGPAFMSTQISHHEQAVSLGPLFLSLSLMCPIPAPWALNSLIPIMMKSLSI